MKAYPLTYVLSNGIVTLVFIRISHLHKKEVMQLALKPTPQQIREHWNLTIAEVAEITRLSPGTISRLESSNHEYNIHYRVAEIFSEAFGYRVDDIRWPRPLSTIGRPPLTGRPIDRTHIVRTTSVTTVTITEYSVTCTEVLCPHCLIRQQPIDKVCSCCGE